MEKRVIKLGCTWQYNQDPREIEIKCSTKSEEYDELCFVAITDRVTMQVCILRQGKKYGIYTCDHTNGMGGPGVFCSPTVKPFPYDEVKYCSFPMDDMVFSLSVLVLSGASSKSLTVVMMKKVSMM